MAVVYRGDKYDPKQSKVFRVGVDKKRGMTGMANVASAGLPPSDTGYTPWQSPSSDGKGEQFFRKYDRETDSDYLYSAEVNTRKLERDRFGRVLNGEPVKNQFGIAQQRPEGSILGVDPYSGFDYIQETKYNKVGPAPGANPPNTRQPERAKKRNSDGDKSKGGNYSTKRNKAGAKGTILTGARGLLGNGGGGGGSKTLLGN